MLVEVSVKKLLISVVMLAFSLVSYTSTATLITHDLEVVVVNGLSPEDVPELGTTGSVQISFDDSSATVQGSGFNVLSGITMNLNIFGQLFTGADDFMFSPRLTLDGDYNITGIEFTVYESVPFVAPFNFVDITNPAISGFGSYAVKLPAPDVNPYLWEIVTFGFDQPGPPTIPEPSSIVLMLLACTLLAGKRFKKT